VSDESEAWLERHIARWRDVLPEDVAIAQVYWVRLQRMKRGLDAGSTLAEVGFEFGLSGAAVRHAITTGRSQIFRSISPVEKYLTEVGDVRKLASRIIYLSRLMKRIEK
jgi:hypothetical protein